MIEEIGWEYPLKNLVSITYTAQDKQILRELGSKMAEIASLPEQKERKRNWQKLNDLEKCRPLVWINEIPWHEMNVDDELTLETSSEFSQFLELRLKKTISRWNHMRVDMVVEPVLPCYIDHSNSWFDITEQVEIARTDESSVIYSRDFIPQIKNEEDVEKIKTPRISINRDLTEKKFQAMSEIFHGVLEVEKRGVPGFWFSPWDELIRWWDVQDALLDLALRPDLVHKAMNKLTDAYLDMLDQYEKLDLLALNNGNYRVGSGGLGYTNQLPQDDFDKNHVRPIDLWGNGTAQIFSDVSPAMHEEYSLQYELKWMEKFGLNYYGCCEPLHKKINLISKIPRLRKISMSPWVDLREGSEQIGRDYVFSYKPSPSIFVHNTWEPKQIADELFAEINTIKNCNVEILMKDISTVQYKPEKLWKWAELSMEVVKGL
jgi:hypothetical protein